MVKFAYVTDKGLLKPINEDSLTINNRVVSNTDIKRSGFLWKDRFCIAVFDGVGGKDKGEVASGLCANAFKTYCKPSRVTERNDVFNLVQCIQNDLEEEQQKVGNDMMTTFVGVVSDGKQLVFMNMGDSRAYLYTKSGLKQYSYDDTYRNQLKMSGYTKAEIDEMDTAHIITSCLGVPNFNKMSCHSYIVPFSKGDVICLMSDGISDLVGQDELEQIIYRAKKPYKIIETTSELVKERGAHDNYTMVVIKC